MPRVRQDGMAAGDWLNAPGKEPESALGLKSALEDLLYRVRCSRLAGTSTAKLLEG